MKFHKTKEELCEHFTPTIGCIKDVCSCNKDPKKPPFKHKVESLSTEEVLANRSNAYEFIDFEKKESLEEAAERFFEEQKKLNFSYDSRESFAEGYKLAQEKMYSEEEVIAFGEFIFKHSLLTHTKGVNSLFEQFKNK